MSSALAMKVGPDLKSSLYSLDELTKLVLYEDKLLISIGGNICDGLDLNKSKLIFQRSILSQWATIPIVNQKFSTNTMPVIHCLAFTVLNNLLAFYFNNLFESKMY